MKILIISYIQNNIFKIVFEKKYHNKLGPFRVPTHEEGAYLFWEFASDSYDLGFGVYFEWSQVKSNQVSVAINESSDEEDFPESEEEDEEGHMTHGDAERGTSRRSNSQGFHNVIITRN